MIGLIAFTSVGLWLVLSLWVAWRAAKLVKPIWLKALVGVAIAPALFVAPVADELIGRRQFEHYCKEAEEMKIYGTIPVGEELYTSDGKWKLSDMSLSLDEQKRLADFKKSLIRWSLVNSVGVEVPAAISIRYRDTKAYEVKTGRLLAEFRIYSSRGGWLSRTVSERAMFMPAQCLPRLLREGKEEQEILPFIRNVGGEK